MKIWPLVWAVYLLPAYCVADTQVKSIILTNIDVGGVILSPSNQHIQNELTRLLLQSIQVIQSNQHPVEIRGHTDSIGSQQRNLVLSQQRAQAFATYLVLQGVNAHRLIVTGYGERQPIADNKTREGRAKNRRVELIFIKDDQRVSTQ